MRDAFIRFFNWVTYLRGIFGREVYMLGVLIFRHIRDVNWVAYFGGEEAYIRWHVNRVSQYINWLIANIK